MYYNSSGSSDYCKPFEPSDGCDADSYGDFLIGWSTAKATVLTAEIAKDLTDAAEFPGASLPTAGILAGAQTALAVIEGVKDAVEYTDAMIEGTMIQVTWQNAKRIISNQNRVQNNVQIQGDRVVVQILDKFSITPPGRRLAIQEAAEVATAATAHDRHRKLLDPSLYLRGYGCDSIDNDNNLLVDECGEDKVPANLDLLYGASCLDEFFLTEAELRACVERNLQATDDCHPVNAPTFEGLSGTCGAVYLDYSVNTSTCTAENHVQETFGPFRLDDSPPVLAALNCPSSPLPHNLEMVDLGPLGIAASDDCGIAHVTVKVLSDESTAAVNAKLYRVRNCTRQI